MEGGQDKTLVCVCVCVQFVCPSCFLSLWCHTGLALPHTHTARKRRVIWEEELHLALPETLACDCILTPCALVPHTHPSLIP